MSTHESETLTVPKAIVISAIIIAGAIFFSQRERGGGLANQGVTPPPTPTVTTQEIRPVSSADHILGNPDADIVIVEYSDTQCPFCKSFHPTMQKLMDEYGKTGKVAWVYRHFPLDSIHPKARTEARAAECAEALGGNTKFWAYLHRLFAVTPTLNPGNTGLDPAELPRIAEEIGLDKNAFTLCLATDTHDATVEADLQDGIAAGIRATPHSVLISKKGDVYHLKGAQPYSTLKTTVDALLAE